MGLMLLRHGGVLDLILLAVMLHELRMCRFFAIVVEANALPVPVVSKDTDSWGCIA